MCLVGLKQLEQNKGSVCTDIALPFYGPNKRELNAFNDQEYTAMSTVEHAIHLRTLNFLLERTWSYIRRIEIIQITILITHHPILPLIVCKLMRRPSCTGLCQTAIMINYDITFERIAVPIKNRADKTAFSMKSYNMVTCASIC